jgi:hypothetical protein
MDADIENQDDEIERLLGFTPPGETARRRRRERMAATAWLEAHAAARRHLIEQGLMTREAGNYELTPLGATIWRAEHRILASLKQN